MGIQVIPKGINTLPPTQYLEFAAELRRLELIRRVAKRERITDPDTRPGHFSDERYELEKSRKSTDNVQYTNPNVAVNTERVFDGISIIDIDAEKPNKGINIITLPFIPKEVNWNTDSSFVAIKPIGRNNAKYQYTGSEDSIEFEIDWHSFDLNRDDVIKNCRIIESLAKSDGYSNPPHRILLKWGDEDVLFRDMVFIVTSAPYRLTQFNKAQYFNKSLQKTALLPIQAYQKVTLARITSNNLSTKDIQLVQSTKYY